MSTFKFVHAADLHLDSPLIGLRDRDGDIGERIARASKTALNNLIGLAIEEGCKFVVLAGDIFDGDIRNFQSALHFAKQMRQLKDAGIAVFIALGNHDAENKFMARLDLGDNVHIFASRKAETIRFDDIGVAFHGQSFPKRDVTDNIASGYPAPLPGYFNVGVLHTACAGRAEHHAPYAPCSLEQLVNHGYGYWALGHVHKHQILSADPWVVYPGNLQGRSAKETGPKGAMLIEVHDGAVRSAEHRTLDAVRWEILDVDVTDAADLQDVSAALRMALDTATLPNDRLSALRLRLVGTPAIHNELAARAAALTEDLEATLATHARDVWLEKVVLDTALPIKPPTIDPSIAGKLATAIAELRAQPGFAKMLEARLEQIRAKMPPSVRPEQLIEELRAGAGERAAAIALSLISETPEAPDEAA
jgi:exonuclease SbcD